MEKIDNRFRPIEAVEIGMGATRHGFTDLDPNEVIAKTPCTVTVRAMTATRVTAPTVSPGGFAGHAENHEQKWDIASNPEGVTTTLRLGKQGWKGAGCRFSIGEARKFYDYNF